MDRRKKNFLVISAPIMIFFLVEFGMFLASGGYQYLIGAFGSLAVIGFQGILSKWEEQGYRLWRIHPHLVLGLSSIIWFSILFWVGGYPLWYKASKTFMEMWIHIVVYVNILNTEGMLLRR